MVRIRDKQMAALAEAAWERFAEELEEHLPRVFPGFQASLPEAAAAALIRAAIGTARADGMTGTASVTVWAECTWVFGPAPWKTAWAEPLARHDWPLEVRHQRFVRLARAALAPACAGRQ